ncbi:hypothetical protein TeGR_g8102, partial [Tetraparma gracilis]
MSTFAQYCSSLPVSLVQACDSLTSSLATSSDPSSLISSLFAKALSTPPPSEPEVDLVLYYLRGLARFHPTSEDPKAALNDLKMYAPLPLQCLQVIMDKLEDYKGVQKGVKGGKGISLGRLQKVDWRLGVMTGEGGGGAG